MYYPSSPDSFSSNSQYMGDDDSRRPDKQVYEYAAYGVRTEQLWQSCRFFGSILLYKLYLGLQVLRFILDDTSYRLYDIKQWEYVVCILRLGSFIDLYYMSMHWYNTLVATVKIWDNFYETSSWIPLCTVESCHVIQWSYPIAQFLEVWLDLTY